MIRLASFLAPGDLRPRLGAVEGAMMRDLTATHGADWDMRRVLALPTPAEDAAIAAGIDRRFALGTGARPNLGAVHRKHIHLLRVARVEHRSVLPAAGVEDESTEDRSYRNVRQL